MTSLVGPWLPERGPAVGTAYEDFAARRHFSALDGVRCVCIMGVLWHHAAPPRVSPLFERGFLGVDMFFVLSGFLIVTLLLRERRRTGTVSLRAFYVRRTLRIFPVYYGVLAALAAFYWWKASGTSHDFFAALPCYLLYVSNWSLFQVSNLGVTWSLATEEQFYILWPAIERWLRPPRLYVFLGVFLLANQLVNFGVLDGVFASLYGLSAVPPLPILEATFTPIGLGVGLAHLLHHRGSYGVVARIVRGRAMALLLALALGALLEFGPVDMAGWPRLVSQLLMAALLASLVVREDGLGTSLLRFRPIRYLGEISYGMYLFHLWAFQAGQAINERVGFFHPLALLVTGSLATVAIASVSFHFYERPFLRLKSRFERLAGVPAKG